MKKQTLKSLAVLFLAAYFSVCVGRSAHAGDDDDPPADDQSSQVQSSDQSADDSSANAPDSAQAETDIQTVMSQCNDSDMSTAQASACLDMLKRVMRSYPWPGGTALMDKIQSQANQIAAPEQ
jgi:hypothetical protein